MMKAVVVGAAHGHVIAMAGGLQKMPEAQVLGVYDEDPARRQAAAGKLGVAEFATLQAALGSGATVALIGAVPGERAALAVRCVEAGVGVVADKPLAVTHEALDELIGAVGRCGRAVMTYYPYRGSAQVLAAKAALGAGRIGKLVRVMSFGPHKLNAPGRPDWHWTRRDNGGCLIDIGSHHFDVCCFMAGQAPVWVAAQHHNFTQPQHGEFQDYAEATMQFPSGTFGRVEADWLNPSSMRHFGDTRIWLQGTIGKIELRLGDEVTAQIWTPDAAAQPLDTEPFKAADFSRRLYEAVAHNQATPIAQDEIWLASRVALLAFDSANQDGARLSLPTA
jgi:predicted dehydrogenase